MIERESRLTSTPDNDNLASTLAEEEPAGLGQLEKLFSDLEETVDLTKNPLDAVGLYLKEIGAVRLLKSREEEVCLAQAIERGEQAEEQLKEDSLFPEEKERLEEEVQQGKTAWDYFVRANLRLVVFLAKKAIGRGVPFLDLIQEGNVGLIRAVNKFNYRLGNRFSIHARWWIRQEITRAIANQARTMRLPVHRVEKINRLKRTKRELAQELGREPTNKEIADAAEMSLETVERAFRDDLPSISLDAPVDDRKDAAEQGDFIEGHRSDFPDGAEEETRRKRIKEILETLSPREQEILSLRLGFSEEGPLSLEKVGRRFGLTRERIRQIEAGAIEKLRDLIKERGLKDLLKIF